MRRLLRIVLLAALGSVLVPGPAAAAPTGPQVQFRLTDPRLTEVSGIAAGLASPGVVYVHNDSGDSARFFALDARTGTVLAVYSVPGARSVDWEDIAVARDARGVPSIWLGDIGDNDGRRGEIEIYRVDEPHVDRSRRDVTATSTAPQVWRLRYPDGATDAESLAVAPGGAACIVTKSLLGRSVVYAVPSHADRNRVQQLRRIGAVTFHLTGTAGPFGPVGELAATGADISRDGTRLVVRTYTDAYLWAIKGGDVGAALQGDPVRVPLPRQPQGEGIAFAGDQLFAASEQVGSAVYAVPVPAVAMPTTAAPAPSESVVLLPPATHGPSDSALVSWLIVSGAVAVVVATLVLDRLILRRRPDGRDR